VRHGSAVTITVDINGEPLPDVRWYVKLKLVSISSKRYRLTVSEDGERGGRRYSLTVVRAKSKVTDKWVKVTARNRLGADEGKVQIKVYSGMSI